MARIARAAGESKVSAAALLLALVAGMMFWNLAFDRADASHEPADKVAASSSAVRDVDGTTGQDLVILSETVRVSSTADLILQAASECALITEVSTGDESEGAIQPTDTASARATITYYVTIDGDSVPVSQGDSDLEEEGVQGDDGRVVFCDRLYTQTATDQTSDGDIDQMDSYIESRTANGFNWLALDVGKEYDDDGDNLVDLELHAVFEETATVNSANADALVGRTSLIIEPTHVSVHEQVLPVDEGA